MAIKEPQRWLDWALASGRFPSPSTAEEARRLASGGGFEEALDVLAAVGDGAQEGVFWVYMLNAARDLGDAERAAGYYRRYLEASGEGELHELIEGVVRSSCSVADGLSRVIAYCAQSSPNPGWQAFLGLPVEEDLVHLRRWLRDLLAGQPPPQDIDGLRFGIFNIGRGGVYSSDMDLAGTRCDHGDDSDWPLGPASWRPSDAAAGSLVLAEILKLSVSGGVDRSEYILCLTYGGLAARWLATELGSDVVCSGRDERVIAAGFDEGDGLIVGTLSRGGLRFPAPDEPVVEVRSIKRPVTEILADLVGADEGRRHKAGLVLGGTTQTDRSEVPDLVAALEAGHPGVRFWVVTALEGIGPAAAAAVPALITLLRDPHLGTRQAASMAIAAVGAPAAAAAIEALTEMSSADESVFARADAIRALGALADDYPEVVPAMAAALHDPERNVRSEAAISLKVLGPGAHQALDALQQVVADDREDDGVRLQAEVAVRLILAGA